MDQLRKYLFITLLILIILNLNGVAYVFFNLEETFRLLYLAITLTLFFTSYNLLRIKKLYTSKFLIIFLILYVVFGTIATIVNFNWSSWLSNITSLVVSILIAYVIIDFLLREAILDNFNYWTKLITRLTIISALSGILIKYTGLEHFGRYRAGYERVAGFFANPNELGLIANMAIVFLFTSLKNKFKFVNLVLLILVTLASLLTFSKGAIITTSIIWFVYFFMFIKFDAKTGSKVYIIITVLVSAIFFNKIFGELDSILSITQSRRVNQVTNIVSGNIDDDATSGRLVLFNVGLDKIKSNPIIGYGIGSFSMLERNKFGGVHNTFLLIIGESGIFPFLFLIYIFIYFLVLPFFKDFDKNKKFIIFSMTIVLINYMMSTHGVFKTRFFLLFIIVLSIHVDDQLLIFNDNTQKKL